MGLLTNLWKLVAPTHPSGFCPKSFQEYTDAIINGTQVTFLIDTGTFLYNYGTATPAPENRIFPWLNPSDGLWWNFLYGLWVSPVSDTDMEPDLRRIWIPPAGTLESAAWALDGGSGTDPSVPANIGIYFGAFWEVDHDMDGRFPLGAGTIPNSDLGAGDAQVGINQTADSFGRSGEYAHLLTDSEGAVGQHVHAMGLYDTGSGSGGFAGQFLPVTPVSTYNAVTVPGNGTPFTVPGNTTANMFTLKANDGAGVTSDKHNTMPGYRSVWFLKHTTRRYRARSA